MARNDDAYTFWVHGVDVHVQNEPNTASDVRRNSQGTRVQQGSGANWFHFAIPTPTELDNKNVYLSSITLKASVNEHATIDKVHIYSGTDVWRRHDGLGWTNMTDFTENLGVPKHYTTLPVAVCIYVEFEREGEVQFQGAGGCFYRIVGDID